MKETDSDTGEWKWKGVSGVTYGNNGFYLLKDVGNSVTDYSGNNNNFTAGGGGMTKRKIILVIILLQ